MKLDRGTSYWSRSGWLERVVIILFTSAFVVGLLFGLPAVYNMIHWLVRG